MDTQQDVLKRFDPQGPPTCSSPDLPFLDERLRTQASGLEPAFRAVHYDRLADLHFSRYQLTGEPADLQASMMASSEAVVNGRQFTERPPEANSDIAQWWALQAERLRNRYDRFGITADLDDAITTYEEAIQAIDSTSPLHPVLLLNQANTLCMRYEATGSPHDIGEAIQKAEATLTTGHEYTASIQNDLSTMYLSKYEREDDLEALESAVCLAREAVERSRVDESQLTGRLLNLASALTAQYEHSNSLAIVEEAILVSKRAVERSEEGGAIGVVQPLSRLARAQYLKYTYTNDGNDLHTALQTAQDAIDWIHSEEEAEDDVEAHTMLRDLVRRCRQEERTIRNIPEPLR